MQLDRPEQDSSHAVQLELFASGPFTVRLLVPDTVDLWWEHDWKDRPKARTCGKHRERIKRFFKDRYCDEVSKFDIEKMRRDFAVPGLYSQGGLKPNSINTPHGMVTRMFNWLYQCREVGVVHGIDFRKVPLPPRNPGSLVPKVNELPFANKTVWPKKVVYRLIGAAISLNDLLVAEIIEALYLTRLRPCDLWRITDKNVDLARGVLTGIQHKTVTRRNPSGKPYVIAIRNLNRILRRRMEVVPSGTPLFVDGNLSAESWARVVQRRFTTVAAVANLPHVKLKHLRPSSATLLLDNNVPSQTVVESLGHSDDRMLPVYTPRKIVHLIEAQEVLERDGTEILV